MEPHPKDQTGPVKTVHLPDLPGVDVPGAGVTFHWHPPERPGPRARHGIVVPPILAGDYEVSTLFASSFASRGYSCLRFERRVEWLDAEREPEVLGPLVAQYVEDIRRGIAWWSEAGDLSAPLGLFGVSMGAIIGTVLAAREPSLGPAVLCMGGGPLTEVLTTAREEMFDDFRSDLTKRLGGWESALMPRFVRSMKGHDPIEMAPLLDPSRVLFVGTIFDRVIHPTHQNRLWEALGRPRRIRLPCGHYSAALFVPLIRYLAGRWFDQHFELSPQAD